MRVGVLVFGLQPARISLWASTHWPSSQAKVTSVNLLSRLAKSNATEPIVLMHTLILVIWGDTKTANGHINVTSVTTNIFASQLLGLHIWIELYILTGFGSCFIMCLFSFEGCAATKSHWVQFKECWSSVDWNLPMWPSLVFTTLIWTLWVVWMCFSKNSALFNVLSFYCTGFRTCFYQCAFSSDLS